MDADRIRQAVVDSTCSTCPELVEGGMERVIDAQAEVREAALSYADWLDGPTNGAFLVEPEDGFWPTWACDALTELFKERGIYPESGPRRQGFVGAEEVLDRLEAVFQARKEADRG